METVADTILVQFQNSPVLTALIEGFNECLDPEANLDAFCTLVWDIETAQGYGLDLLGRLVGVGRVLPVATSNVLGFKEALPGSSAWDQGTFYPGGSLTSNYALSDDAYRLLILAKAAANICDGSIPAINRILLSLFPGRGNCYVADGLDMSLVYTFKFPLSSVELAIVTQSGVLPRGAGVASSVVQG